MHKNEAPQKPAPKKKKAASSKKVEALGLLQAIPDPVLSFMENGRVTFANLAAQEMFRRSEKALLEVSIFDLLEKGSPVASAVETMMRNGKTLTLHDVSIAGRYAHTVSLLLLSDSDTHLMVVTLHAQHLTTEWANTARNHLRPAQMMARALAHEIKNPLAGIQGAAQLLGRLDLKDDDLELLNLIRRETDRILRLVEKVDIFDVSPAEKFKRVNIHEVLKQVTQASRTAFGPGVEISETYDPSLPDLNGDFDFLMQAKMNLIKNAAEALPGNTGQISIRTFYDNAAALHPESMQKLPLCVEIEDNGQGIDPEALRRIFDPYFTTKPNGQGLGLSIVSKIVDDHGGAINVKSQPGKTVFRLSFPMEKKPV
jgi:two-component system nitrogen regulation sensor histidine kinase GlnL